LAKIYNSKILDSEEKFWTDLFYEKIILNENLQVKHEIYKLRILSKEKIKILYDEFLDNTIDNLNSNYITYEKLHFYIEEILKLF
jgi:hypothetical protein